MTIIPHRSGFDAAVSAREHDYLDRWPFAQEIYGIATTGPRHWSVRVGVYGEWGTGKTSVLHFVRVMAQADGHIIVSFNPWQFSSTNDLWRDFVKTIFHEIENQLGESQPGKLGRGAKRFFGRAVTDVPKFISVWRKEAGTALETGLSYAKRFLSFGPDDLAQLQQNLGNRRIIVLVDDLDRTDPKLVPEMLFAVKEIMDVPGMAFVCAFDPVVVGKVLGLLHPGFGDGLEFLEKIIDYPRWLPRPTIDRLVRLARSDADEYCPYVPKQDLEEVVSFLPANPRAIRQFVRLLRLLRPQTERHRPDEIRWPILLAANAIKIRFPLIAEEILTNERFWHSVYQTSGAGSDDRHEKRKKVVDDEVEKLAAEQNLDNSAKRDLNRCVWAIARRLQIWFGIPYEGLMYQFHLAERPCAVTWKEFDDFLTAFRSADISAEAVADWIRSHANKVGRSEEEVFNELFDAATRARLSELGKAADTTLEAEMALHIEQANRILQLLSVLILDLGHIGSNPRISSDQMKALLESVAQYFTWRITDIYVKARTAEERLLSDTASKWGPKILPLADALELRRWEGRDDMHGAEWRDLVRRLREIVNPKFASLIIDKFSRDSDFLATELHGRERGYRIQGLLLDKDGAIWKDRRKEMLSALDTAPSNETLRGNTYGFLEWIEYLFRRNEPDAGKAAELLSDNEAALSLWKAATSHRLNPRAVGSFRSLYDRLQKNGLQWNAPGWWTRTIADLDKRYPKGE